MANTVSPTISDETLSRIIDIESSGNPDIKAKTSSATGLGQFLNATWLAVIAKHRPDLMGDYTRAQLLALRTDPAIAIEMLARFTEDNAAQLGPGYSDGDLYLAHFSGVGVARKLLRANPDALASTIYSRDAVIANRSILEGKTVGQVRDWAGRKMAKARTDWVEHYAPARLPPQPIPTEQDAEPIEHDVPLPGPRPPDPAPSIPENIPDDPLPAPTGGFFARVLGWLKRQWGKLSATGVGSAVIGFFTDYRVWLCIIAALLIAFAIALYLFGKDGVKDWIKRKLG